MVVSKMWCKYKALDSEHNPERVLIRGWFLFGFIPLYIKEVQTV